MAYSDGKKIVRNKHIKKIGIIAASVATVAIVVVIAFAFIRRGSNSDFTIRFDNTAVLNNTKMFSSLDGEPSVLLVGDPIKQVKPVKAEEVENYLDELMVNGIEGSQNMPDKEEGYEDAIVYTVYLKNTSDTEVQKLYYELKLEHLTQPSNDAVSPLEYMRTIIQTSTVNNEVVDDTNMKTTYYGAIHSKDSYATVAGVDDMRECISGFKKVPFSDDNPITVREPTYIGKSEDGYCVNYMAEEDNDDLILEGLEIAPKETLRFTFVTYFEGRDPDCSGEPPMNCSILMSLHFGAK